MNKHLNPAGGSPTENGHKLDGSWKEPSLTKFTLFSNNHGGGILRLPASSGRDLSRTDEIRYPETKVAGVMSSPPPENVIPGQGHPSKIASWFLPAAGSLPFCELPPAQLV